MSAGAIDPALLARYRELSGNPDGVDERLALAERFASADGRAVAWMQLAFERFSAFRFATGHEALERTLAVDPNFLAARWARFQMPDNLVPASAAEAQRFHERWRAGLIEFEGLDFRDPRWRAQVWGCVGQCTAFYLHYLGDCVAEQRRYGALVHRMMAALDPGRDLREHRPRARPRVLFVSAYLHEHTVGRLFVPLVLGLDPARVDVHALQLDPVDDALSARLAPRITLHRGPKAAPDWRRLIVELAPDAIVYSDIGMHPMTQGLAALRLAPRQLALWGHPVTTGLPTLDGFLSPDAMEPDDADSHYTERLIRLPGLGHGLEQRTEAVIPADLARPDGGIELFCAQSIYKLLPEHDALFARVLARLPAARLHLIAHQDARVRAWLVERMRPAFTAAGLDVERCVVLHPMQPLAGFLGIAASCDLALDSLVWSGGMSSLDLLGIGLPVIALPGGSMRSRQSAALLQRLGTPELIALDQDDYVARAVAMALDAPRRAQLKIDLIERSARLHADTNAVTEALQALLLEPPGAA
jgi:protein O-GlcNAc transferase